MTEIKILVIGSINIDEFFTVPHIVLSGETVTSTNYTKRPGGKGANQAVALAKAAVGVWHVGKIGHDGIWIKEYMAKQGVNVDYIFTSEQQPTGRAFIQVSQDTCDNAIALLPGANHTLSVEEVENVLGQCKKGDWIVIQNEIGTVGGNTLKLCKDKGLIVTFNPAPLSVNIMEIFSFDLVDYLILNKLEAKQLHEQILKMNNSTGLDRLYPTPEEALKTLSIEFPQLVGIIITLGSEGLIAWYRPMNKLYTLTSFKTTVRDSTGAGDAFTGYFVASIARNQQKYMQESEETSAQVFLNALKEATVAAGLAVSKPGAMESIPYWNDVQKNIESFDTYCKLYTNL
ncbi:17600_t:CDS:2 [Acaulospora morrowiae]|uniref:Ribokinase n=1 Tax=Acaulospora morrowiae TaxID=94023 RepID=A0A9N9GEV0_9GLOM|nr:17600_t:CDS:2 [Acaulospora morrowiae]